MHCEHVFHTLEPWVNETSRILILGTMPSPKSRESGCYYGHPQNRFWPTLSAVFNDPFERSVEECKAFAERHNLALWDVLASCEIRGAEDAAITSPIPNDVARLCREYPIEVIVTTGTKAHRLFCSLLRESVTLPVIALPSTSPANRRWYRDDALICAYEVLRKL